MQTHATARHHGLPVGILAVVITCAAAASVAVEAQAPITFEKGEYAARRARLMDRLDGGFAVLLGAQPVENYNEYYQNNDFVYLTGVEIPNAILLVDAASRQ